MDNRQEMKEEKNSTDKEPDPESWFQRIRNLLNGVISDREHLLEKLREAQSSNLIDIEALAMIEGVLQVSEMQVRDIMIPRSQMVVIERDGEPQNILNVVINSAHSRFPVIGESKDKVVGILLAKDLLPTLMQRSDELRFNIRDMLRPAVIVPESKRLNVLLKEFRANRNHMAIVVDEYGGVAGLVTIEDVLEQIVGEIEDEHDFDEDTYILKYKDSVTVKAITPIETFNEHFHTSFSDEEFDTIGGLVINALGHLPKRGETLQMGGLQFRILRASSRRVHLIKVSPAVDNVIDIDAKAAEGC